MKTKLFLLTIAATMSFSMTACAKESVPAGTAIPTETVAEEESTVVPTETETTTTLEETETETSTDVAEETASTEVVAEPETSTEVGPYTEADLAEYAESDLQYLNEVYQFLCRMDPSLEKTDDILTILNSGVLDTVTPEQLLDLLNQDFSKAYDIIEKCGLDVTTDEGKVLKASEMRENAGTITDFDSFHDAYQDIIEYTGCLARASVEANENLDVALENEDAANGSKYLELVKLYQPSVDELWEFVQFYQMAYDD